MAWAATTPLPCLCGLWAWLTRPNQPLELRGELGGPVACTAGWAGTTILAVSVWGWGGLAPHSTSARAASAAGAAGTAGLGKVMGQGHGLQLGPRFGAPRLTGLASGKGAPGRGCIRGVSNSVCEDWRIALGWRGHWQGGWGMGT